MYYEVYVDVLFVKNLWMNGMLLLLTAWADQEKVKICRIAAAAVTGSLGVCLMYLASAGLSAVHYVCGSLFGSGDDKDCIFRKEAFCRAHVLPVYGKLPDERDSPVFGAVSPNERNMVCGIQQYICSGFNGSGVHMEKQEKGPDEDPFCCPASWGVPDARRSII